MKKILAGLVLMASMGSAQAVLTSQQAITFNPVAPGLLISSIFQLRESSLAANQLFDDVYTFNFAPSQFVPVNTNNGVGSGTAQVRWDEPLVPGAEDGVFTAVNFYRDNGPIGQSVTDTLIGSSLVSGSTAFFSSGLMTSGNYYVRVQGQYDATPLQSFVQYGSGNLSITAVPEPSEWALMLSGLGLMGFVARRRRAAATEAA